MKMCIRLARTREDRRILTEIDRKSFPARDAFGFGAWKDYEAYLIYMDGELVGSVAFKPHIELDKRNNFVPVRNALYVASTAILPEHQGRGWGMLIKAWQITFAHEKGFTRLSARARRSNARILNLDKKFGFRVVGRVRGHYRNPAELALILHCRLN